MHIGLALGSGSSRGWAHIGVISALTEQGIIPDIVCGTSIGSLVGASYVSDTLEKLERWVCSLTKFETARFFDINPSLNGFVDTERLHRFLNEYVANDEAQIEELGKQYAAVNLAARPLSGDQARKKVAGGRRSGQSGSGFSLPRPRGRYRHSRQPQWRHCRQAFPETRDDSQKS
jgi:hypothetical protein